MIPLNIRFHPDREELIFPDITEADGAELGEIFEVVVVENGVATESGKDRPSVVLRVDSPNGPVIVMTTARLMVTLATAILAKHPDLMEDPS